jgi:hypothetical protein
MDQKCKGESGGTKWNQVTWGPTNWKQDEKV